MPVHGQKQLGSIFKLSSELKFFSERVEKNEMLNTMELGRVIELYGELDKIDVLLLLKKIIERGYQHSPDQAAFYSLLKRTVSDYDLDISTPAISIANTLLANEIPESVAAEQPEQNSGSFPADFKKLLDSAFVSQYRTALGGVRALLNHPLYRDEIRVAKPIW